MCFKIRSTRCATTVTAYILIKLGKYVKTLVLRISSVALIPLLPAGFLSSTRPQLSLYRIPEIRILNIGQIVKSVGVGIDLDSIRISLGCDLPLVSPDEHDPRAQNDCDEARVESHMNDERIDVPGCPISPE